MHSSHHLLILYNLPRILETWPKMDSKRSWAAACPDCNGPVKGGDARVDCLVPKLPFKKVPPFKDASLTFIPAPYRYLLNFASFPLFDI